MKLGQSDKINLLTEKALDAFDQFVEADLYSGSDPEILSKGMYAETRTKYFAALDALGKEITVKVGIPYQLRLKSIEDQYRRRA